MFDSLEARLAETFKKLRGHGTLTEANLQDALRDVRLSLLEADVHFKVVKDFMAEVKARSLGREVSASLNPTQEFVRIVSEELTKTMGERAAELDLTGRPPVVILLMGLQGSGKTTTSAKLAQWVKERGKKPLLVPADVQRPAAIQQLKTLAQQVGVDVFDTQAGTPVSAIVEGSLADAKRRGHDVMIVDTAGRLQIDLELMDELREAKAALEPKYSLLVVDSMTGQDAVNVAGEFKAQIGIDGVVMTKLDGDARGGAALSVRSVTGAPIFFAGIGEKMDGLEVFHPSRVAQRILGMGDVMGLIEKTQKAYDEKQARQMARKMKTAEFSLEDFREQMSMMRKMGNMKDILGMIPGMSQAMKKLGAGGPDPDREMRRIEAMIGSMTPHERARPEVLNGSRRKRIAGGSGTTVAEVNSFLKRFKDAQRMMKKLSKMGPGGLKGLMRGMPGF
ncbi:MAG: signal recognition particle protein [Deltaproteobacteria bacterium]|nr:signal recognition particle protein [Deltaproteobacteria bacterium]